MMVKEKEAVTDGLSDNAKYAEGHIEDSNQLERKLNARHLRMIAIGGTIGTGLFIASGSSIATAGPVGSLLAYGFVGTMVYSVMNSLGEMGTYIPISGAFTAYATRFVHPSLGYAMGWINWFQWAMTYALQLTATGLIIQYWAPHLDIGIFIGVFWVLLTTLNFFPVSIFGEFEFWLSLIKIITVIGFVIFAICIDAGAGKNGYLGFSTWKYPGAFAPYIFTSSPALGKFVGFWSVLITAGFSFQGIELIGIAAGECENPRKNVPEAIRKTFIQVLVCFMVSVFFIGLLVPSNSKYLLSGASDASASPFVIAAKLAGVKVLPEIINGVLLFVIISASISSLYSGSRMLMGLAADGSAPSIFTRTNSHGVPYVAVAATSIVGLLGFLNESERGGEVFDWLVNIISIGGFITWFCISLCHIAFIRALATRGISRETLPFCAVGGKWFAWYGLLFNVLIMLTQGFKSFLPWDVTKFITSYITIFLFVVLFMGHCLLTKSRFVSASEADIATGCISCLPETWENEKPRKMWERVIGYII
ncbi:Lysine-specific permease [Golovinomyces cichoracearum]|uniref:Lysine-specific permease n=1 Tax=Golovinomyces cichoracearum TaxID=62708 RepID=A0A420HLB8_9PEZI|nr:Lysine-specific permease [Golovinomyces cichoracearum]